jgi:hypothetical protein
MTLEPFIGGACFVDIRDRKHSTTLQIEYDTARKRLALPERGRQAQPPQPAPAAASPDLLAAWSVAERPAAAPLRDDARAIESRGLSGG